MNGKYIIQIQKGSDSVIYIGQYRELCNKNEFPSIKDSFEKEPYKGMKKIVHYLKNGTPDMVSTKIPKDVISGEVIPIEQIGMNDGKYTWWNTIAYYVEKYNLRLPKEIEEYILSM